MLKTKPPKQKTCKICKDKFVPIQAMQPTCADYFCIRANKVKEIAKDSKPKKTKEARLELREYKKTHKPTLLQLAQTLVNTYIRTRDEGLNCVSCNHNFNNGRIKNAGHYVRVSKSSFLRFHEDNINLQCSYCNNELNGNEGAYKSPLIAKIGIDRVKYLEENRTTLKTWTVEELQEIITKYRKKIKEMLDA